MLIRNHVRIITAYNHVRILILPTSSVGKQSNKDWSKVTQYGLKRLDHTRRCITRYKALGRRQQWRIYRGPGPPKILEI